MAQVLIHNGANSPSYLLVTGLFDCPSLGGAPSISTNSDCPAQFAIIDDEADSDLGPDVVMSSGSEDTSDAGSSVSWGGVQDTPTCYHLMCEKG